MSNSGATIEDIQQIISSMMDKESDSMKRIMRLANENNQISTALLSTLDAAAGLINTFQNNMQDLNVIMQRLNEKKTNQDQALSQIEDTLRNAPKKELADEIINKLRTAIMNKSSIGQDQINQALPLISQTPPTMQGGFQLSPKGRGEEVGVKEVRSLIKKPITRKQSIKRKSSKRKLTRRKSFKRKMNANTRKTKK